MNDEPFWGGHPHFRQTGLDHAMKEMLDRIGDAIDIVEVRMEDRHRITATARRHPSMTPPDNLPQGYTWLPSIESRPPLVKLEDADADGRLMKAINAFVATIPYAIATDEPWPYRTPSLTLRRDGTTLEIPTSQGKVAIYSEGREKQSGSNAPYWMNHTSFYLNRRPDSASDILAAGGMPGYIKDALLGDPMMIPPKIASIEQRVISAILNGIDLPLDAYVTTQEKLQ